MSRAIPAAVLGLVAIALASVPATAADPLTIDFHYLQGIQAADHASISVYSSFFLNNSGSSPFSGSINLTLPAGARVDSSYPGCAANTVARYYSNTSWTCFFLAPAGGTLYRTTPFNGTAMAFYGQRSQLTLQANSSLGDSDSLTLNVTAGAPPVGQQVQPPTTGLQFGAETTELGGPQASETYPMLLTFFGNVTLYNYRNGSATVDLTAGFGEAGWSVTLLDGGVPLTPPTALAANSSKTIGLRLEVPNYITVLDVEYTAQMTPAGDRRWSFALEYPYPVRMAVINLFLVDKDNVTVSGPDGDSVRRHTAQSWDAGKSRWSVLYFANGLPAGAAVRVVIFTEGIVALPPLLVGSVAVAAAAALIGLALYLRHRRRQAEEAESEKARKEKSKKAARSSGTSGGTSSDIASQIARARKALDRLEKDHKEGRLPDESYERMKGSYERRVSALEEEAKTAAVSELATLKAKKAQLLAAIKALKAEREAGEVDPETAQDLEKVYRDEVIEVMRRLDEIQG